MQQPEEKVRERLLLAAVPEVGQEKGKQMVSVFLHATPPTLRQGRRPTPGAFGGQGSGSGVLWGLTVLQSDIMKKRISKSLKKTVITKKGPSGSNKETEEGKGGLTGSLVGSL